MINWRTEQREISQNNFSKKIQRKKEAKFKIDAQIDKLKDSVIATGVDPVLAEIASQADAPVKCLKNLASANFIDDAILLMKCGGLRSVFEAEYGRAPAIRPSICAEKHEKLKDKYSGIHTTTYNVNPTIYGSVIFENARHDNEKLRSNTLACEVEKKTDIDGIKVEYLDHVTNEPKYARTFDEGTSMYETYNKTFESGAANDGTLPYPYRTAPVTTDPLEGEPELAEFAFAGILTKVAENNNDVDHPVLLDFSAECAMVVANLMKGSLEFKKLLSINPVIRVTKDRQSFIMYPIAPSPIELLPTTKNVKISRTQEKAQKYAITAYDRDELLITFKNSLVSIENDQFGVLFIAVVRQSSILKCCHHYRKSRIKVDPT